MLVSIYHNWSTQPETQVSTHLRVGKAVSFRVAGVNRLQMNLVVTVGLDVSGNAHHPGPVKRTGCLRAAISF